MATNGGTLQHGLPPTSRGNSLVCLQCNVMLDSVESLNVHNMNFHSSQPATLASRWFPLPSGVNKSTSSTASNSPTDSENNNQPKHNIHNIQHSSKSVSPLHNTISAAADSSDNQPPTTQPPLPVVQESRLIYGYNMNNTSPAFQHQPNIDPHYQPYGQPYDQYYSYHGLEYSMPHTPFLNSQSHSQQEYKSVPFRYQPYTPTHTHPINNSLSPVNVSSSSPTHSNIVLLSTTSSPSNQLIPTTQTTPSPSPNQCDKCGHLCETGSQLSEHYATSHSGSVHNESNRNVGTNGDGLLSSFSYHYVKDEQPCDILDLDSQKMVYSPNDEHSQQGPLPPMHSLHPLQRTLIWPDPHHGQTYHQEIKSAPTVFHPSVLSKQEFSNVKQDYLHHQPQIVHQQQSDAKSFASDVTGNQMTSSPSEFPSTTTPQENGPQFRASFEATSSLPTNAPSGKSSSWKSNEARRPKTYNCTACSKWFTSSGHLKRHYNTTLHKNAVKSSGNVDPATMPISLHHHPTRDQNKINHHQRGSPAQPPQQQPPPTDQTVSPEYNSPYTTPPLGFQQTQAFQQYGPGLPIHSNTGSSPNGQAGPSVLASQPRGLQIYMNNTGTQQMPPEEEQHLTYMQLDTQSNTELTPDPYNTLKSTTILTTPPTELSLDMPEQEGLGQNFLTSPITGNSHDDTHTMLSGNPTDINSIFQTLYDQPIPHATTSFPPTDLLMGGVAYPGNEIRHNSPEVADAYQKRNDQSPVLPQAGATHPASPMEVATSTVEIQEPTTRRKAVHRCNPCQKVFSKPCYLTQHNKSCHSGERPHKCKKCGKRFPTEETRDAHFANHGDQRTYLCKLGCGKVFCHSTDLRRHNYSHSDFRPYRCGICEKGFVRHDHMVKHILTHERKANLMAKKLAKKSPK